MKTLYKERLKTFADYLVKQDHLKHNTLYRAKISILENGGIIYYESIFMISLLEEIPFVFKDWGYDIYGKPVWDFVDSEERSTIVSLVEFFCLGPSELSHLFEPACQQTKRYGGKQLTSASSPADYAHNIYEYLKSLEFDDLIKSKWGDQGNRDELSGLHDQRLFAVEDLLRLPLLNGRIISEINLN